MYIFAEQPPVSVAYFQYFKFFLCSCVRQDARALLVCCVIATAARSLNEKATSAVLPQDLERGLLRVEEQPLRMVAALVQHFRKLPLILGGHNIIRVLAGFIGGR